MMEEDVLLIQNGTVLDPATGLKEKKDMAIKMGKSFLWEIFPEKKQNLWWMQRDVM